MPSIVPGFEYDIFISYRQKDNRGDRWVTEFVNALKSELDATFKEDLSVYFDENPHDGLLETHDVDASLREKLKCLIFIPIISQTYCDTKSFAWQHEFVAFKKLASEDRIGLKVKLQNGNVASRILPVRIHELDDHDKTTLEDELGPIRAIDFVFKSTGVNRPLRAKDDETKEITHSIFYRDQVNKVANAIKETVEAIKNPKESPTKANQSIKRSQRKVEELGLKLKNIRPAFFAFVLFLSVTAFVFYYRLNSVSKHVFDYDVGVMYIENFTNNEKYGDQLASLIHINLAQDTSLRLLPRQKLFDGMKETTGQAVAPDKGHASEIAKKNKARTILTGSLHQQNDKALVQLELIEVETGKILKSEKVEGKLADIFALADEISKRFGPEDYQGEFNVALKTTRNYEAYQKFYSGLEDFYAFKFDDAREKFRQSVSIDTTFALGYLFQAQTRNISATFNVYGDIRPAIKLIEKARKYSNGLSDDDKKLVETYHYNYKGDFITAKKMALENYKKNPGDRVFFFALFWAETLFDYKSFEKSVEEYLHLNPSDGLVHNMAAYSLGPRAQEHIQRYIALQPNTPNAYHTGWEVSLMSGQPELAREYITQLRKITHRNEAFWEAVQLIAEGDRPKLKSIYFQFKDSVTSISTFQELLAYDHLLGGNFNLAANELEKLYKKSLAKKEMFTALLHRLHQAMVLSAAHRSSEAEKIFNLVTEEAKKLALTEYNPFALLGCYHAGIMHARNHNLVEAEKRVTQLDSITSRSGDWRYKNYSSFLKAEIAIAQKDDVLARKILSSNRGYWFEKSICYFHPDYVLKWRAKEYDQALNLLIPFYKNILMARIFNGGDPALFTIERTFAEYNAAKICEDADRKEDAIKYYQQFLERFKNSEPGILEKSDAEKRLKYLLKKPSS